MTAYAVSWTIGRGSDSYETGESTCVSAHRDALLQPRTSHLSIFKIAFYTSAMLAVELRPIEMDHMTKKFYPEYLVSVGPIQSTREEDQAVHVLRMFWKVWKTNHTVPTGQASLTFTSISVSSLGRPSHVLFIAEGRIWDRRVLFTAVLQCQRCHVVISDEQGALAVQDFDSGTAVQTTNKAVCEGLAFPSLPFSSVLPIWALTALQSTAIPDDMAASNRPALFKSNE
ncbi:hypothetical protein SKAU_G00035580 [Synaphobranchus kaupii]|uniref:Uncharacterized protein n=1 Tax=Synaphobranchus kaupii TaxID=118154 RepID=A0A9Q1GG27_SYNKA|nr:hypothetical protein SKAU_G00035580 [Synaphobranchus kaupii]